jgi:hypothetical protein
MIVTAVFVGNDVQEIVHEHKAMSSGESAPDAPERGPRFFSRLKKFLASRLHTYSFVSQRFHTVLVRIKLRRFSEETIEILKRDERPETARGWGLVKDTLLHIKGIAADRGALNLVLIIPVRHQINRTEWKSITGTYGLNPSDFDLEKPQRVLRSFCRDHAIPCIDLTPALRADSLRTYNMRADAHFSPYGHGVVSREISRYVKAVLTR